MQENCLPLPHYCQCWNLLESTPAMIPLIKSIHKWTRILFIISNSKLGIWLCSQPRIDLNSQSNFYDVLTRTYKYLFQHTINTLYKTTCTQDNLHVSFTIVCFQPNVIPKAICPTLDWYCLNGCNKTRPGHRIQILPIYCVTCLAV